MDVVQLAIALAVPIAVLAGLWWVGRRARQSASSIMGPFEEIWHPAAHRARVVVEISDERLAPRADPAEAWEADSGQRNEAEQ